MNENPNPQPLKPAKTKTRANSAELSARIETVLFARLHGAELYDLVALAAEKKWRVSTRTLQRYSAAADRRIERSLEKDRGRLLRRHLAQRRSLFARAINDGDLRTALAIAQDEAELEGLYPKKGLELSGVVGTPQVETRTDAERIAQITAILSHFGLAVIPAAAGAGGDSPNSDGEGTADGPLFGESGPGAD